MAAMSTGTFTAWSSVALRKLEYMEMTDEQSSWVVAATAFGVMISTIPNAFGSIFLGKKTMLMLSCIATYISWMLVAMNESMNVILLSRLLGGIGAGIGMMVGAVYTAEIAEDSVRGTMTTLFQSTINVGILIVYCIGPYVPLHYLHLICATPSLISYMILIWLPESPYFLLYNDKVDRAQQALLRLRGKTATTDVDEEFQKMIMLVEETKNNAVTFKELFICRRYLRSLSLCIVLMTIQAFSGNIAILAYASEIFRGSGSNLDVYVCAMVVGVVQLVMSIVASIFLDKVGRRPMLIFSLLGCTLAMTAEGSFFMTKDVTEVQSLSWIPVVALMVYMIFYSVGLGPIPWTIASEILPLRARGIAVSIVQFTYTLFLFFVIKSFQILASNAGIFAAFWMYGSFCLVGAVFVLLFVPETMNKSFQQIEIEFGGIKIINKNVDSSKMFT